jgi:hypothetical protein
VKPGLFRKIRKRKADLHCDISSPQIKFEMEQVRDRVAVYSISKFIMNQEGGKYATKIAADLAD